MKPFDKAAAMRGARVCTRTLAKVRILCFDFAGPDTHPIVAAYTDHTNTERIEYFTNKGMINSSREGLLDLMMADDDYLDKLDRGEYGTPAPAPDPWDEFKRKAALEIVRKTRAYVGEKYVDDIVDTVNSLVYGLKSK